MNINMCNKNSNKEVLVFYNPEILNDILERIKIKIVKIIKTKRFDTRNIVNILSKLARACSKSIEKVYSFVGLLNIWITSGWCTLSDSLRCLPICRSIIVLFRTFSSRRSKTSFSKNVEKWETMVVNVKVSLEKKIGCQPNKDFVVKNLDEYMLIDEDDIEDAYPGRYTLFADKGILLYRKYSGNIEPKTKKGKTFDSSLLVTDKEDLAKAIKKECKIVRFTKIGEGMYTFPRKKVKKVRTFLVNEDEQDTSESFLKRTRTKKETFNKLLLDSPNGKREIDNTLFTETFYLPTKNSFFSKKSLILPPSFMRETIDHLVKRLHQVLNYHTLAEFQRYDLQKFLTEMKGSELSSIFYDLKKFKSLVKNSLLGEDIFLALYQSLLVFYRRVYSLVNEHSFPPRVDKFFDKDYVRWRFIRMVDYVQKHRKRCTPITFDKSDQELLEDGKCCFYHREDTMFFGDYTGTEGPKGKQGKPLESSLLVTPDESLVERIRYETNIVRINKLDDTHYLFPNANFNNKIIYSLLERWKGLDNVY